MSNLGPEFQFTGLTRGDRVDLVNLTADYSDAAAAPATANQLALSALGAWLDVEGSWGNADPGISLAQWKHIAAQGRDQYVRVVHRGYLFPTGHRAVLITVIERVFAVDPKNVVEGYLQKTQFFKVTQPLKTYPAAGQPFAARDWPFTSVLIPIVTSPLLDATPFRPFGPSAQSGMPQHNGTDLTWPMVATDAAGHQVTLTAPLAFIHGQDAEFTGSQYDVGYTSQVADAYNTLGDGDRTATTDGGAVQFAPDAPDHPGGTSHPTVAITLSAATTVKDPNAPGVSVSQPLDQASLTSADQPAFYPVLGATRVRLAAAEALARQPINDGGGPGIGIAPYPDFVVNGLTNAGAVYAQAIDTKTPPPVGFPADAVGAIATPNFAVTGLSAVAGAVGGTLDNFAQQGVVQAKEYFAGMATELISKLLGGLSLIDIIGPMPAPTIMNLVDQATKRRTIRYHMEAPLKEKAGVFIPAVGGTLTLDTVATFDPVSGQGTYNVEGRITPFVIQILGDGPLHFIDIPFNGVHFTASNASKPHIDVDIGQVKFAGALSFVNDLEKFLENLGGSGFSIVVSPTAVDANMSLALPSFGVGVFNMENLSLNAGVHVPFVGDGAIARFSFCTREHPFLLTVMCFGGGGFIGLGVGLNQVEFVEASLEFGAQLALDLGVASGGVTVAAGVYFKYDVKAGVTLTGFVRINGDLEVLGLVSVSVELDLELTYQGKANDDPNARSSVGGTATLRVEVSIAFFSTSVELSVHKEFAGGDPSFKDMVPDQPTWQAYCNAFAA